MYHSGGISRLLRILTAMLVFAGPSAAQQIGWGDLDAALLPLSPTGQKEVSLFLPESADPATAQRGLGILYAHIPGSAGSVSIHTAILARDGATWRIALPVTGLFGQEPRDQVFFADRMEVTMSTLGPGEARCCPTKPTRFSIDLRTGQAVALN